MAINWQRVQLISFIATIYIICIIPATTANFHYDLLGSYCGSGPNPCCRDRLDDCNRPISGSLCYCDEFCNRTVNGDCCPDYRAVCLGLPDEIKVCLHKGHHFQPFDPPLKDNCNLCKCMSNGETSCETDLCLIDEALVHNVNLVHSTWTARNYSEFWGRKYSDGLKLRTGTFEPQYMVKRMSRLTNRHNGLPSTFDSRVHWPGMIGEPKDQGWCGSSWVVSTTSVASDRFAIQSKGRETVDLSAQQLLSCVRKQQACNGGHLDVAWSYLRKTGVVDEDCYPYAAGKNKCKVRAKDNLVSLGCDLPVQVPRTEMYRMGPAYALNNETDIMQEIKTSGPVQATMRVYRDFFTYGGGIYNKRSAASRSDPAGFHSVKLVGWGEDAGVKYWIAANSWGTWWGEDGYFRIERGTNECEIENYVLASWADVYSKPKTRPYRPRRQGI